MIKYSQLDSPTYAPEVHESRGLILEKDKWNIISMPFKRFFNYNDVLSPKLDWNKTHVMEKRDGTLIQIYFDYIINEWCVNTMFSECEEDLYFKGEPSGRSFKTIFFDLFKEYNSNFDLFNRTYTYVFELTSPYNKVVVSYDKPELRLISVRDLTNLKEMSFDSLIYLSNKIRIPIVETYKFSSLKECLKSFEGKSFNFEGYVAFDDVNRIKIKNPAYVAVHLTKQSSTDLLDLTKPHIFLDIVKQNEIDEFKSYFPHASELIDKLDFNYKNLIIKLNKAQESIIPPKNITPQEKKLFATNIFKSLANNNLHESLSSIFFMLHNGKIDDIQEYINNYDNKKLYELLK